MHLGGVEAVAEEQLAAERAVDALTGDDVVAVDRTPGPLGADGEHVALVLQVDRGGIDAGQIEVSDERVAVPVGVHREARPLELVAGLLQGAVDLTEGIEPKQHRHGSYLLSQVGLSLLGTGATRAVLQRGEEATGRADVVVTDSVTDVVDLVADFVSVAHIGPAQHVRSEGRVEAGGPAGAFDEVVGAEAGQTTLVVAPPPQQRPDGTTTQVIVQVRRGRRVEGEQLRGGVTGDLHVELGKLAADVGHVEIEDLVELQAVKEQESDEHLRRGALLGQHTKEAATVIVAEQDRGGGAMTGSRLGPVLRPRKVRKKLCTAEARRFAVPSRAPAAIRSERNPSTSAAVARTGES